MVSVRGSVCLLVLLGVVLASGGPIQFISDNMKQAHGLIANELDLKLSEVGSNPLFSFVIRNVNTTCQRRDDIQLMNATLDVYMRIFSSILQHKHQKHHSQTQNPGVLDHLSGKGRSVVTSELRKLQQKMEDLRSHLNILNPNKDNALTELEKIQLQVDDPMVQRKALAEFLEIFQTASVVGSCSR